MYVGTLSQVSLKEIIIPNMDKCKVKSYVKKGVIYNDSGITESSR